MELPGSAAFTTTASYWNGLAVPNGSYGGGAADPARMPNDILVCPDELFVEFTWEIDIATKPTGSDPQIVVCLPGTTWDAFVADGNTWLATITWNGFKPSGGLYYRLDMVDLDGSAVFSNTIWLSSQNNVWAGGFLQVVPNPFTAEAEVRFFQAQEGVYVLQVTDVLGRPVYERQDQGQEGLNRIPIDLGAEAAGTYVVTVTREDGMTLKQRVVKSTD